uniref:Pre-PUA domain-containing protein n=1 Tax=Ditylenchus dipsaci TaxID=166011 RepID=A0A915EDZ7_9BILA
MLLLILVLNNSYSVVRAQNSLGVWVNIYVCDKNPVFFEPETGSNSVIYPSVYFTWMSPNSFPILFVNQTVFGILENGADLMLPGVLISDVMSLHFPANFPVAIAVASSFGGETKFHGPIAVGKALMSSEQMLASGMKGRGVQVLHFYHDTLWEFGAKTSLLLSPWTPCRLRMSCRRTTP